MRKANVLAGVVVLLCFRGSETSCVIERCAGVLRKFERFVGEDLKTDDRSIIVQGFYCR